MRHSLLLLLPWLFACASTSEPVVPEQPLGTDCSDCSSEPSFARLVERTGELKANDVDSCNELLQAFKARTNDEHLRTMALFNLGVVAQTCGKRELAISYYREALEARPTLSQARVRLALLDSSLSHDARVAVLQKAVLDSSYTDAEALLELGRAQRLRNNREQDQDGPNDRERARKNFMRALAVQDRLSAARNELAMLQLDLAREESGRSSSLLNRDLKQPKLATQSLELALLLCSQALLVDASYAPLYNTLGLVQFELGGAGAAAKSFDRALELAPDYVEAHLNSAALNIAFRSFARAEQSYRHVRELQPNSYDARLGLALALRGQASDPTHGATKLQQARAELAEAIRLSPGRPEAHFNLAALEERFGAGPGGLAQARDAYQRFASLAQGKPEFASDLADVTSIPTRSDEECMRTTEELAGCKRGRLFDLSQLLTDAEVTPVKPSSQAP